MSVASCTTSQKQIYMNSESLLGIKKVAVVASVNTPNVSYSLGQKADIYSGILLIMGPVGLLAIGLEAGIRNGVDEIHAADINKKIDLTQIEDKIAEPFIQMLNKGGAFQTVEYVKDKTQDNHKLSMAGYNAVIRLSVVEILLSREWRDNDVMISVVAHCQMESLDSDKIILARDESASSNEFHTLDYYKKNGLQELNTILEKIATNFSYDFLYLKFIPEKSLGK